MYVVVFVWLEGGGAWAVGHAVYRGGGVIRSRTGDDLETARSTPPLKTKFTPNHPGPDLMEATSLLANRDSFDEDADADDEEPSARHRDRPIKLEPRAPTIQSGPRGSGLDFASALRSLDDNLPLDKEHQDEWGDRERDRANVEAVQVKADGSRRWCRKCDVPKPDRAHHCSACETCVYKMDHHCEPFRLVNAIRDGRES